MAGVVFIVERGKLSYDKSIKQRNHVGSGKDVIYVLFQR